MNCRVGSGFFGEGDAERRARRLAELRALSEEELSAQLRRMRRARNLPRLSYHFGEHGEAVGAGTLTEFNEMFGRHVARGDLRYFTFIRRIGDERMWYLLAEDTGLVAQYNETRQRPWTFFTPSNLTRFIEEGQSRWVEVRQTDQAGWKPVE